MNEAKGHVLITGAAIRVGRVIALMLAKAGYDTTIHYHTSLDEAECLAQEIKALGRIAALKQADLANPAEVAALIKTGEPYPLTALVNNASLFLHDSEDPDGSKHRAINYEAPCNLTQALYDQLPSGAEGCVVHILDHTPVAPTMKHYGDSRARLRADVPNQAQRYAPRLRINAVEPGPTLINPGQSHTFFQKLVDQTLLKRPSRPEDIASSVLFLIENRSITGQVLATDSGMCFF